MVSTSYTFVVVMLTLALSVGCADSKINEPVKSPGNCAHAFVVHAFSTALVLEYSESSILFLGQVDPPFPNTYLDQVSYDCSDNRVLATFNGLPSGSFGFNIWESIRPKRNKTVASGLLLVSQDGAREFIELPRPYRFERFRDELLIDSGHVEKVVTSDGDLYGNIYRINLSTKKVVATYPFGGDLKQMIVKGGALYAFDTNRRIDLTTARATHLAGPSEEKGSMPTFAITSTNRIFALFARLGPVIPPPPGAPAVRDAYEMDSVYEIVDSKFIKRFETKIAPATILIAVDQDLYVFGQGYETAMVLRYNTQTGARTLYKFPHAPIEQVVYDGERFIVVVAEPKSADSPQPPLYRLHVATRDFSSVITADFPIGSPSGISTNARYSGN